MTFLQQLVLNGVVAVVAAGGLVGLLTLRQQRRKVGADADVGMATAAETLTGAALLMVQQAATRATAAEAHADQAEADAQEAWRVANAAHQRIARLIAWLRTQNIEPPDWITEDTGAGR